MPILYQIVFGIALVIIQTLTSDAISVAGVTPDFALIYLIWIVIRKGQLRGELSGFALGLGLDILSGGILGSQALSKTVAGFLLGYFYNEEKSNQRLRNWPFLLFVALAAVINNVIYYILFTQARTGFLEYLTERGGYGVLYTTIVAIIPMIYFSRKTYFS
jgi:rod shape-determining protein MreD